MILIINTCIQRQTLRNIHLSINLMLTSTNISHFELQLLSDRQTGAHPSDREFNFVKHRRTAEHGETQDCEHPLRLAMFNHQIHCELMDVDVAVTDLAKVSLDRLALP